MESAGSDGKGMDILSIYKVASSAGVRKGRVWNGRARSGSAGHGEERCGRAGFGMEWQGSIYHDAVQCSAFNPTGE
jgi:hypothetical protein